MIIEFSVNNFLSFKNLQTLSFVAAKISSKNKDLDEHNIIHAENNLNLLKSLTIYGANGSGKSNLVEAFYSMITFISKSFKDEEIGQELIEPFMLDDNSRNKPTYFQIIFFNENRRYRYGFEYKDGNIVSEWLFGPAKKNEVEYFTRDSSGIYVKTRFSEGLGLESKTKRNQLFLNVVYSLNGLVADEVKSYFRNNISINMGLSDEAFHKKSILFSEDKRKKAAIYTLLKLADIGIQDFRVIEVDKILNNNIKPGINFHQPFSKKEKIVITARNKFDDSGKATGLELFELNANESEGTIKLFDYSAQILETLLKGKVLIIDEFDARFHPMLTKKIVQLFNSDKTNKKGAQLFFVTHDTNLLGADLLRRDQVYFVEKNEKGESNIYSLAEFKGIRNNASFEKDYIKGKYGAIPFLGDFSKLID